MYQWERCICLFVMNVDVDDRQILTFRSSSRITRCWSRAVKDQTDSDMMNKNEIIHYQERCCSPHGNLQMTSCGQQHFRPRRMTSEVTLQPNKCTNNFIFYNFSLRINVKIFIYYLNIYFTIFFIDFTKPKIVFLIIL